MSDPGAAEYQPPPPVDGWLEPLADGSGAGPDLEYDAEALELVEVSGKPETQFGPAEPPNWTRVAEISESLFQRTRDLRFATSWSRARLNVEGYAALPPALALLHGLLERFWDDLNPKPDADDAEGLSRLSILGTLAKLDGLLGDLRSARLSSDRQLDGLRVRDAEISSGRAKPRPGESARTKAQLMAMLEAAPEAAQALQDQTAQSMALLKRLKELMVERFGADKAVDLKGVEGMLASVAAVLPPTLQGALSGDAAEPGAVTNGSGRRSPDGIESREDAIRAIEQVCDYLERHEPTNPAQLLLRRAARVIDKNFLQLVRDLAPDAVREVAKVMGVDPATVKDDE